MDVIEAIEARRSIRAYTKESVPDDEIEPLLRAAMYAPSAANAQPWHFIVIRDRKILDEIPQVVSTAQMVRNTPLAIAVLFSGAVPT
ncbi:MAG: nitroreductase family protein [Euryarchaeota archaeon]|nr:nitroreductase family protein [Euryarchaeota archaeon]